MGHELVQTDHRVDRPLTRFSFGLARFAAGEAFLELFARIAPAALLLIPSRLAILDWTDLKLMMNLLLHFNHEWMIL